MLKLVTVTECFYPKMLEMSGSFLKEDIIEQRDVAYGKFTEENQYIDLQWYILKLQSNNNRSGKESSYSKTWAKQVNNEIERILK